MTVEQASELSDRDPEDLEELIWDGGVDVKQGGDTWYIERDGLHDLRGC